MTQESPIDKARRLLANEEIVVDSGSWRELVSKLVELADEANSMRPFAQLGAWAICEGHLEEIGDIDGGLLQEAAVECGVLVKKEVTESCGEGCRCAEYGDFPLDCFVIADVGTYSWLVF